ncbi:MAG TPA: J domain-containing protein [Egibacteraceae bacterium]|nr:J domain-containing protein [Egibacteraceae bacterium]
MRDLYEILGVSRDASDADIKRAYRARARALHPDAGGEEEEFKELTTAYEVLKNPQARANYDRFGDPRGPGAAGGDPFAGFGDLSDLIDAFFGGGFSRSARTGGGVRRTGRDALVDVAVTLEEAAFGVQRDIEVTVARPCEECGGSGAAEGGAPERCQACGGAGAVQQVRSSMFGQVLTTGVCTACSGAGQVIRNPCAACRGEGRTQVTDTVTIDIPPGVDDGTRLRLSGRGEAGRSGGAAGDLYVRVRVAPHPVFTRDGADLHCELRLGMVQAALGADVNLETLHGEEKLSVPPGTQSGGILTLRRHGVPKLNSGGARGNLSVHCRVETARNLSAEEAELLRRFAELRGEPVGNGAAAGKGLLGRLREAFGT